MNRYKSVFSFSLVLALLLLVSGCGAKVEDSTKADETAASAILEQKKEHSSFAKLAGSRIDLQNANSLKPGDVTLSFKLYGIDTHSFGPSDLKVNFEKPIHLLLVRDDLTGYQHLHPEFVNGLWTVSTQILEPGSYNAYVDFEPTEEKPTVLRLPIIIGSATEKKKYPAVSTDLSETVGELKATLNLNEPIKVDKKVNLTFNITQNNVAVTTLEPYLGAFGHVVVLSHPDASHFEHAHAASTSAPVDGNISFEAEFPANGMYTIFAQFKIGGEIKTFPITVKVGEDSESNSHM